MYKFEHLVNENILCELAEKETIEIEIKDTSINFYYLFVSPSYKFLVRKIDQNIFERIFYKPPDGSLAGPKDSRQSVFMHSLHSENTVMSVFLGPAGTGKTYLALSYAIEQQFLNGKRIILSKPTATVGRTRAFGPVPGDIKEKYSPYIDSYKIVIRKLLGEKSSHFIESLIKDRKLEFQPIEFVRGSTYENCVFILDEVQNLTWHELKTVVSRMGKNSKIIIAGDLYQKDIAFRDDEYSGIETLINSKIFKNSDFTSLIFLNKQYRSRLANLIYRIDNE